MLFKLVLVVFCLTDEFGPTRDRTPHGFPVLHFALELSIHPA